MKNKILILLLLGFFTNIKLLAQNFFELSGTIKNYNETKIHLTIYKNWVESPLEYDLDVNKKGTFYSNIPIDDFAYCDLSLGEYGFNLLKIEPSDQIKLEANYLDFDRTLKISGQGSGKWKYAVEQKRVFEIEKDWDFELNNLNNISKKGFFDLTNYLYNEQNSLLLKWKDSLSEAFYAVQRADVFGKYKGLELGYLMNRHLFKEGDFNSFNTKVFNSRTQVRSYEFGRFIENLIEADQKLSNKYQNSNLLDYEWVKAYSGNKELVDKNLMERILAIKLLNVIEKDPNTSETELLIANVKDSFSNKNFVNIILKKYSLFKKFKVGSQINDFILPNISGDLISIKDFKGKNVFLSFFSTWCQPCLEDLESINFAEANLKNDNIVFLNILIDDNKAFKEYAKLSKANKLLVWSENLNYLNETLGLEGVPMYILIDKNGIIRKSNFDNPNQDEGRLLLSEIQEIIK